MARRIAITKRIDLSDIAEGWDDCYAVVTVATIGDVQAMATADVKAMNDTDATATAVKLAKDHFVKGRIRVLNDEGESELQPMEPDDIEASVELFTRISAAVTGVIVDPKASSTATETSSTPSPSSEQ